MKKLWSVEIVQDVVVLAETQEEAEKQARHAVNGPFSDFYFEAQELTSLPPEWDETCLPYAGEGSKSIADYEREGAAPEYTKAKERMAKVYEALKKNAPATE